MIVGWNGSLLIAGSSCCFQPVDSNLRDYCGTTVSTAVVLLTAVRQFGTGFVSSKIYARTPFRQVLSYFIARTLSSG